MVGNGLSRTNKVRGYATAAAFPTAGQTGVWYFDLSTGTPYIWDGTAYQDVDPIADDIWVRNGTVIEQVNDGDDLTLNDAGGDPVLNMDVSASTLQVGATDEAGVHEVKDASNVVQAKLNSVGIGYHTNQFVVGGKTGVAMHTVIGSDGKKVRTIASATGTIAITDNFIAVDYTTTGAVALDLPSAATAWEATGSTGIIITVMDIDANASGNNITISRDGADTIIDTAAAQTSTVLGTDGGVLRFIPINATTWKVF